MAKKKTEKKEKKLGLFDFLNAIQQDQSTEFFDNLSDGDKKQYKYSKYMIHRFLSMNVHYSPIVNAVQKALQSTQGRARLKQLIKTL